jgi:hypothetical protein
MEYGAWDAEAYVLETVVSVYDRGSWVGDLNILGALKSKIFFRLLPSDSCGHAPQASPTVRAVSIDHWDELLQTPDEQSGIVRANGNWLSRFAATALSIQSSNITAVLSDRLCWKCYCEFLRTAAWVIDETEESEVFEESEGAGGSQGPEGCEESKNSEVFEETEVAGGSQESKECEESEEYKDDDLATAIFIY